MNNPWMALAIATRIGMAVSSLALGPPQGLWLTTAQSEPWPGGEPIETLVQPADPLGLPDPVCVECRFGTTISAADPHQAEIVGTWDDVTLPTFQGSVYVHAVLFDGRRLRAAARPEVTLQQGETLVLRVLDDAEWSWTDVEHLELSFVVP